MIGRLHNKARKKQDFEREARAKIRPVDMSLVDKSCRDTWNTDDPINDTRMIICACGHKRRFHIALGTRTVFRCSKCGTRRELKF